MDYTGTMTDPNAGGGNGAAGGSPDQGGFMALLQQLLQGGMNAGQGGMSLLSQLIPGAQAATPGGPGTPDGTPSGGVPATKLQGPLVPERNGSVPNLGNFGNPSLAPPSNPPGSLPAENTAAGATPSDVNPPGGAGGTSPLTPPNPWAGAPASAATPPAMNATPIGTEAPGGAAAPGAANPDLLKALAAAGAMKAPAIPPPIPVTGVAGGLHAGAPVHPPAAASPVLQAMLASLLQKHGTMTPNLGMLMPGR